MADEHRTTRRWLTGVLIATCILPVLYVLSVGPVTQLLGTGWLKSLEGTVLEQAVMVYYLPLQWLYQEVPLMDEFFDWYIPLWIR